MAKSLKITAIMSVPRLGFTDNFFCATQTFPPLNINLAKHSGAFWEQSLSKLMYERVEAGDDYIITVDYDSIYTRENVVELINLIEMSRADAIFATQVKRDSKHILMSIHPDEQRPDKTVDLSKALTRARTGHFGLTIIRCESLRKLEHPWLFSYPNAETCKWEPGKVDADIFFWTAAEEKGQWKVYQANNIRIGHIQRVITWATKDLNCVHQYVDDYERNGIPKEVVGKSEAFEPVPMQVAPTSQDSPLSPFDPTGAITPTVAPVGGDVDWSQNCVLGGEVR